jgi:hypothetical protein
MPARTFFAVLKGFPEANSERFWKGRSNRTWGVNIFRPCREFSFVMSAESALAEQQMSYRDRAPRWVGQL